MYVTGGTDEVSGLDYKLVKLNSKEFNKKMCTEFPEIFQDRNKSMAESCMFWGFEIGPGWQPLLYKLCCQLNVIYKATGILLVADQVKEKYGGLRFYYHCTGPAHLLYPPDSLIWTSIIDNLCNHVEDDSYHICDSCGKYLSHDQIYLGSWVYAECISCFKKHNPSMIEEVDAWWKETKQDEKD